jgi:carbon-monoxide dehydrogenase small subunit/xanthine dehydrogenase YagT iron-sulfur-binding subunit
MARAKMSRRALLGGSVSAAVGASAFSAVGQTVEQAEDATSAATALAEDIVLKVNGGDRHLRVEPRMTLVEALRGPLRLTGTKIACNRGACSACTVWLDGEPRLGCMTLAIEVGERAVTTIEGLAQDDELHPIQAAFIERDAMQCGFCTPGMEMAAAALIERNPDPTAEDVERAIGGHICRCGTYPHVVAATLAAAKARKG